MVNQLKQKDNPDVDELKKAQSRLIYLERELKRIRGNPLHRIVDFSDKLKLQLSSLSNSLRRLSRPKRTISRAEIVNAKRRLQKSKLFDPEFYSEVLSNLGETEVKDPLEHYLTAGWKLNLAPSQLFDVQYVIAQLDGQDKSHCPLLIFLEKWKKEKLCPNIMFDTKRYIEQNQEQIDLAVDPVTQYLDGAQDQSASPSLHFNKAYYRDKYGKEIVGFVDEWEHFMKVGRYESKSPNPIFDPIYYREQLNSQSLKEQDSLILYSHYLQEGHLKGIKPYPTFDLDFYQSLVLSPGTRYGALQAIEHFLESSKSNSLIPNSYLNEKFKSFHDQEGTTRETFLGQSCRMDLDIETWARVNQFAQSDKNAIVFLGHEASMTGAPMVLLSLLENFSNDYECFLIMPKGGKLLEKFKKYATIILTDYCDDPKFVTSAFINYLKSKVETNRLRGVIANTAEVAAHQEVLKASGLPVLSLVHEIADGYDKDYFEKLYNASTNMIFSSKFSYDQAKRKSLPPKSLNIFIKGQGVLDHNFGKSEKLKARKEIREILDVPENAFIAFGCGSLDLRKGIDFYIKIARAVCEREEDSSRPIYFVWIGDGPKYSGTPFYFVQWDLERMKFKERIKFLPPRKDIEPWFVGSDVFVLPSRQDPLPCVVHNSMACAVPVIAFKNSGGTEELLGKGGGKLVDYGDLESFAERIYEYYRNEEQRLTDGQTGRKFAEDNLRFSEYYQFIGSVFEQQYLEHQKIEPEEEEVDPYFDENLVVDQLEKEQLAFLELRLQSRLASPSWRYTAGFRKVKQFITSWSVNQPFSSDDQFSQEVLDAHFTESRDDYFKYLKDMLAEIRTSYSWRISKPLRMGGRNYLSFDEKKLEVLGKDNEHAVRERTRFEMIDINSSQKRN